METKIPVNVIKPRFLYEVPRSEYCRAPRLQGNDTQSRRSFISLLRKGPAKQTQQAQRSASMVSLNCAAWLHSNKEINQPVSLFIHYKDDKEEYYMLIDESNPGESTSVMLSGAVTIRARGQVEFVRICCAGMPNDGHIHVEEMHVKGNMGDASEIRQAAIA